MNTFYGLCVDDIKEYNLVTIYALLAKTNNYKKCDLDCNHEVNYQKVMDWIESNLKSEEYNGIGTLIYKGLKTECDILTIRSYRDKTYLGFPVTAANFTDAEQISCKFIKETFKQLTNENITVTVWNLADSIRDQEDDLIRAVRNDDVEGVEDFLGYEISDVVLEELDSRLREVVDQMPDEEYSLFLEKYHLIPEKSNSCNIDYDKILWDILKKHRGHKVSIVSYGNYDNPENISLECEDCGEVILDAELYTICAREDI